MYHFHTFEAPKRIIMVHAVGFRYMYLICKDEVQVHNAKVVNKENTVDEISKVLILTAQKSFLVPITEAYLQNLMSQVFLPLAVWRSRKTGHVKTSLVVPSK